MNDDEIVKSGRFDGENTKPQADKAPAPTSQEEGVEQDTTVGDDVVADAVSEPAQATSPESNDSDAAAQVLLLQAQLAEKEAQVEENRHLALRLQADLENQARRAEKQVQDAHKFAAQKFVENIIPVMDSLEMGLQAEGDIAQIREGMQLTMRQFETVFEKFNIVALNPASGEPFNPELHQAMTMQNSPDHENNSIISVLQKGYSLNGRVVRPAMVMVCKK